MFMYSIVIPTKNEEVYLPKLLASIRTQTLAPDAIIVADAKSTDRTRDLVNDFGGKIVDGGLPGVGRNIGASYVQSKWIVFLDADAVLPAENTIQAAIAEAEANGYDLCTGFVEPPVDRFIDRLWYGAYNWYIRHAWFLLPHTAGYCLIVRREAHERIHGFDISVVFCEDHDYGMRMSRVGTVQYLPTLRVPVSERRLKKDGYVGTAVRFFLAEVHLLFLGPIRHHLFRYTFGYIN